MDIMTINRAQQLLNLCERRIKPVYYEDLIKGIYRIIDKILIEYKKYDPDYNERKEQHLRETTKVRLLINTKDVRVVIPHVDSKLNRLIDDKVFDYTGKVGWFLQKAVGFDKEPVDYVNFNHEWIFSPGAHPDSDRRIYTIPNILYHATPLSNTTAILKQGLLPNSDYRHTRWMEVGQYEVIYLAKNKVDSLDVLKKQGYNEKEVIVFRVDTSKLLHGAKFYQDPQHVRAFYTTTRIPVNALTIDEG